MARLQAMQERSRLPLLPPGSGRIIRRRLLEVVGLILALAGIGLLLAVLTFDPSDPSFNRATDEAVGNLLGVGGARAADLLLQGLGLAAFFACVLLLAWGWRLMRSGMLPWPVTRLVAGIVALASAAAALAALPIPPGWPLYSSLGGALGLSLLGAAHRMLGAEPPFLAAGCFVLAALLGIYALALQGSEWRSLGRGTARLLRGRTARTTVPAEDSRARPRRTVRRSAVQKDEVAAETADEPPSEPARSDHAIVEPRAGRPSPGRKARKDMQGSLAFGATGFEGPSLTLLQEPQVDPRRTQVNRDGLEKNARLLEAVLKDFGVKGEIVKVRPGPVVTRYELEPAPGTKTSRVVGLADDIARSIAAVSVRVAVTPGSSTIGIELPNVERETVFLRELLASEAFEKAPGSLPIVLGKDISGAPQIADLARMPHLLVAGTTGSGKSVALNAMILSLLYRLPPERCRLIMVDPKMLELSIYDDIPHLLTPVVTEPRKAIVALKWAVREMEGRYRAMSRLGVRNLDGYNARVEEARRTGQGLTRRVQTGFDPDTGQPLYEEQPIDLEALPLIVVVVDEMADLMLVAGKEVEGAIQRLAQMARAAGIHLIMATQRPSVDVITGTIKANFPSRISFHVTSKIDSRTILGEGGAEQLLGQGDLLYMAQGGRISRIHAPFVSDHEVQAVVEHLRAQGAPAYVDAVVQDEGEEEDAGEGDGEGSGDELYDRALAVVAQHRKASTSFIQRQLQIGYNRAARLVERMEQDGVVSPANHVGKREVLLPE